MFEKFIIFEMLQSLKNISMSHLKIVGVVENDKVNTKTIKII